MNKPASQLFITTIQRYYAAHGRHDLPWRIPEPDGSYDPYKIMVSELMLQQTQVSRVIPKYYEFLTLFPTVQTLAAASLGEVLTAWSGLGYNRRAKFLWQAAQTVIDEFGGAFPTTVEDLVKLPGVGRNTAGAIAAYAFNRPVIFIETNIRTVYIHHFCKDQESVTDAKLLPLVESTLDRNEPRIFYWSLMDYGSYLKKTIGNASQRSKHYTKQSPFAGSSRQIRGAVIRTLGAGPLNKFQLKRIINDARLEQILTALEAEGMIRSEDDSYRLA